MPTIDYTRKEIYKFIIQVCSWPDDMGYRRDLEIVLKRKDSTAELEISELIDSHTPKQVLKILEHTPIPAGTVWPFELSVRTRNNNTRDLATIRLIEGTFNIDYPRGLEEDDLKAQKKIKASTNKLCSELNFINNGEKTPPLVLAGTAAAGTFVFGGLLAAPIMLVLGTSLLLGPLGIIGLVAAAAAALAIIGFGIGLTVGLRDPGIPIMVQKDKGENISGFELTSYNNMNLSFVKHGVESTLNTSQNQQLESDWQEKLDEHKEQGDLKEKEEKDMEKELTENMSEPEHSKSFQR